MVGVAEKHLMKRGGRLAGAKVAIFGAKGIVAGVVGVIAAEAGAGATFVRHDRNDVVAKKAEAFRQRFGQNFRAADGPSADGPPAALAAAAIAFAPARARTHDR